MKNIINAILAITFMFVIQTTIFSSGYRQAYDLDIVQSYLNQHLEATATQSFPVKKINNSLLYLVEYTDKNQQKHVANIVIDFENNASELIVVQ